MTKNEFRTRIVATLGSAGPHTFSALMAALGDACFDGGQTREARKETLRRTLSRMQGEGQIDLRGRDLAASAGGCAISPIPTIFGATSMTREQQVTMARVGKSGRLLEELRKKFKSPRECMRALGLDEALLDDRTMAFDGKRVSKTRRALDWMRDKGGLTDDEIDEFLDHMMFGGGAEPGGPQADPCAPKGGDRDGYGNPTRSQHNMMEQAAHSDPMDVDELPSYRSNGTPRPALEGAMDEAIPHTAACRIAPGLANIRLGVLGY